ncbi:MAG: MoxR family ATPase [Chloroflexi bacterium]|nr:MoxR family ATPase [Chloroflexota bacterium]MBP7044880.1 MoxR family ATPase [Chloroflexota bacterium]
MDETMTTLKYEGKQRLRKMVNGREVLVEPYIPNANLIEAVNIAMDLERPLLLKGEPGCGKTRLAKAVADELNLPYFEWPVKSTSRAQDGLYIYDTIGRLRDAQLAANPSLNEAERARIAQKFDNPREYILWGPLGEAFRSPKRAVLLIDEIDKADIDFPNDLLHELEDKSFTVQELPPAKDDQQTPDADGLIGNLVPAQQPPIIFITSNAEKELPAAFLRRCLFYYIKFPSPKRLQEIVSLHLELDAADEPFLATAVAAFANLRLKMKNDKSAKKVSTSELIDWVKIMKLRYRQQAQPWPTFTDELLFPSVLLKTLTDYTSYGPPEAEEDEL